MPRKNKNTSKHKKYIKPDYSFHSPNKQENNDSSSMIKNKKIKLRTSYDVYKRLIHDPSIGIDLNYISIGYEDTENIAEMPLLDWQMIDDGGDIPMHRIHYFILYLIDEQQIIIWDKKTKLDRLFCSGQTNKNTQSLELLLSQIQSNNSTNIPTSKINSQSNENKTDEKYNEKTQNNSETESLVIINELLNIFDCEMKNKNKNKYKIILSYNKTRISQEPTLMRKLNRKEYKIIAADTKKIMGKQYFIHPKTKQNINICSEMEFSYENSEIYLEKDVFSYINIEKYKLRKYSKMDIEINYESTLDCAYRLQMECNGNINIGILNFSSAKNPGGGWDNGALAQEESIARSSTLIPTLQKYQSEFYNYHKTQKKTMLYSHALIYSPNVIVMKHGNGKQIIGKFKNGYYKCNIITSPAVNAKYYIKRAKCMDYMMKKYGKLEKDKNDMYNINEEERKKAAINVVEYVMRERCKRVLELAMKYNNECLVLGAWGCGVFGNEPDMIARIFADLLKNRYYNVFRKVVFAILDNKKKQPLNKFIYQFESLFGKGKNSK